MIFEQKYCSPQNTISNSNHEWKEHRAGRVAERERLMEEVEEQILVEEEEEEEEKEEEEDDQEDSLGENVEGPKASNSTWELVASTWAKERQLLSTHKMYILSILELSQYHCHKNIQPKEWFFWGQKA